MRPVRVSRSQLADEDEMVRRVFAVLAASCDPADGRAVGEMLMGELVEADPVAAAYAFQHVAVMLTAAWAGEAGTDEAGRIAELARRFEMRGHAFGQ